MVRLTDELHVAVLDPVVDHLDEVAGSFRADPRAAGSPVVRLGRDGLEDRPHVFPRRSRSARHDRGAKQGTFLAAGNAGADEEQATLFDALAAAGGVGEVRVAAIDDDDRPGSRSREQLIDERVHGRPRP